MQLRLLLTRPRLLKELLGSRHVNVGWLVRPSPADRMVDQAREFCLPRLLLVLLAGHTIYFALWIISWWLLGSAVLQGRLDLGWLWG